MSEVKLYLGDCLEILPTLTAKVDAIITDLPYGTTNCTWDVVIPFAPMWEQVKRLLKPSGVFVTTASQPFTSLLVMSNMEWFKYEWCWDKVVKTGHLNAKTMPLKRHENVLTFSPCTNGNYTYNPQMIRGDFRQKGGPGKQTEVYGKHGYKRKFNNDYYPASIIEFSGGAQGVDEHPTQKPLALYVYLILTYTNPGDTVLDFCFGSGTTGVACVKLGRNFIGCEIKPEYYAIAERRIHDAQLQIPLPLVCQ